MASKVKRTILSFSCLNMYTIDFCDIIISHRPEFYAPLAVGWVAIWLLAVLQQYVLWSANRMGHHGVCFHSLFFPVLCLFVLCMYATCFSHSFSLLARCNRRCW